MTLRYTANEAAPACEADEVTPSDADDIAGGPARALYVGGTGDVSILTRGGRTVVFRAVPAGSILPVDTRRVLTATTATNLVALF